MLGIGTSELLLIFAVVLIVFGPNRIPELARYIAKATKMFQEASRELQRQLEVSEWDKDLKKNLEVDTESTRSITYDDDSSSYDDPYESPYDDEMDDSANYDDDMYGTGEDRQYEEGEPEASDMEASQQENETEEAEVVEDIDPAKVEDAERSNRELQE